MRHKKARLIIGFSFLAVWIMIVVITRSYEMWDFSLGKVSETIIILLPVFALCAGIIILELMGKKPEEKNLKIEIKQFDDKLKEDKQ